MKIVLVGFKVSKEKSVAYQKFDSVDGFLRHFKGLLQDNVAEFYSIRIVDSSKNKKKLSGVDW